MKRGMHIKIPDFLQQENRAKHVENVKSENTHQIHKKSVIRKSNSTKKCKHNDSDAQEIKIIFGDDKCPRTPDFIICGAGTTALPLAKTLTDSGFRVLVLESGLDQNQNKQVQQIFANSQFQEDDPASEPGPLNNNIINMVLDPNITTFTGNGSGLGDGFRGIPSLSGRGVGGSGLHYFCTAVKPVPFVLDGTLPSGLNVPDSVPYKVGTGAGTFSLSEAGGSQWNSSEILSICKDMETFVGIPNPQRGESGPLYILQTGGITNLQTSMTSSAQTLLGGDPATSIVPDYNIVEPDTINCVASLQDFAKLDFTVNPPVVRTNSATAWANSDIVIPDGKGNLVGVNGRRLVILTDRHAVKVVKNLKKSKHNSFYADGVEFLYKNKMYFVKAKRIVSAMGGVHSPLFWQRSGFGSMELLNKVGIPMQVNSPYIGRGLSNQFGPSILLSSTNIEYGNTFGGMGFIKYNNVDRRFQTIHVTTVLNNIGTLVPIYYPIQITNIAPGCEGREELQRYPFLFVNFLLFPRSRGYSQITQANWGVQPDVHFGYYNDGEGLNPSVYEQLYVQGGNPDAYDPSNDPSAGLFDKNGCFNPDYDSDIAVACASMDYLYDIVYNPVTGLRVLSPGDDITIDYQPLSLFQIPDQSERWQKYVPYITMLNTPAAHEAGTVMMNKDPTQGCCDGNLKLYGTANCFEASIAILPVQNSGNPSDLLMAIGIQAANQMPLVQI